jgi:hypothetical protein
VTNEIYEKGKQMTMQKVIVAILFIMILAIGFGCSTLSRELTPATIDKKAVAYSVNAGAADANDFKGWPSLSKAERLAQAVDQANTLNIFQLQQLADKNQLNYGMIRGTVQRNLEVAEQRETALFGETGLLSVGLSAIGAGGLTGIFSLMRKKQAVAAAVAEVEAAGADTSTALAETVKGVQSFLDANKGADIATSLKNLLAMAQSSTTKQAVATIKAGA